MAIAVQKIRTVGACNRCGRRLTDPDSVRAGYGPDCYARVMKPVTTAGSDSPDAVPALTFDIENMNIICRRTAEGKQFNIGQSIILHSPTGMEWGYAGSGPADFALNILYRFTGDRNWSESWHQAFKLDFIAGLPREGGVIPGKEIIEWIQQKRLGALQEPLPIFERKKR